MSVQRFNNRKAQIALALFGAGILLLGLGGLAVASYGVGALYSVVGGVFVFRALQSSSVVVDDDGVTTRSIIRTRHYPFGNLRSVDVAVGTTGMNGFGREHLVLHLADGRDIRFTELNSKPSKAPDEVSVVRSAAVCINERRRRYDAG